MGEHPLVGANCQRAGSTWSLHDRGRLEARGSENMALVCSGPVLWS